MKAVIFRILNMRTFNSERPSKVIYISGWKTRPARSNHSTGSELWSVHSNVYV